MSSERQAIGSDNFAGNWLNDPVHRAYLRADAERQLAFFRKTLTPDGRFDVLDVDGTPITGQPQELFYTTRMVHSFAIAKLWGAPNCDEMIEAGLTYIREQHHDAEHGGYVWSLRDGEVVDGTKLAYGHVFVLLAAASAKMAGHDAADALLEDISDVLTDKFWDDEAGLFLDEFNRDWTPFSTYRGYNANMHGVEALLAAYEATGHSLYLHRAGRILDFFLVKIAPAHGWTLPEHFTPEWEPDLDYAGNPMFRPQGTTPGHALELGRLAVQYADLVGGHEVYESAARNLIETALRTGWREDGGFVYTLKYDGDVMIKDRYWWPVTEAIGALATLIKAGGTDADEAWYRKMWATGDAFFVDHARGGWFPEVDEAGQPTSTQFIGKPDIYHSLQACIFPLGQGVSRLTYKTS